MALTLPCCLYSLPRHLLHAVQREFKPGVVSCGYEVVSGLTPCFLQAESTTYVALMGHKLRRGNVTFARHAARRGRPSASMSTKGSDTPGKRTSGSLDEKLNTHALAMVSFIYNRVVAGAAGALRKRLRLSVTEARIVFHVGASDSVTAAELVRILGLDKAAISRGTSRLIELGLIKSELDPQHAGRNILSVTKAGGTYCEAIAHFTFAREEYLLSVLSAGEQKQFLDSLRRILKNVEPTNERVRAGDFWD